MTEFDRGLAITNNIRDNGKTTEWPTLWEKVDFFSQYKMFVMITAEAATEDDLLQFAGVYMFI